MRCFLSPSVPIYKFFSKKRIINKWLFEYFLRPNIHDMSFLKKKTHIMKMINWIIFLTKYVNLMHWKKWEFRVFCIEKWEYSIFLENKSWKQQIFEKLSIYLYRKKRWTSNLGQFFFKKKKICIKGRREWPFYLNILI